MCKNYNSSNRSLVATIAILAICLVIVTGSTFSLFTSNTGVNIAVTAGNVEFEAKINNALKLYSIEKFMGDGVKVFENGGSAELTNNNQVLTLTNITPGDKVELTIDLDNESNVKTAYRVLWSYGENDTLSDLVVSIKNGEALTPVTSGTSQWYYLDANATVASTTLVIELPVDSEQETKVANINFAVEAVQANGTGLWKSDAYVNDAEGLQAAVNSGATKITLNESITLENGLLLSGDASTFSLRSTGKTYVFDLNGNTLTATGNRAYLFTVEGNANLVVKNGKLVAESTNHILNGTGSSTGASSSIYFNSTGTLLVEKVDIQGSVRGGHRAIDIYGGTAVLNNVNITSSYGAGVVAGGEGVSVTLNNCNITVNGMYSAPYNSVCFGVWGGAEMTVNSGNYKMINNNTYTTGDTHGGWVGIVMSSGGTLNINDGTYTNVPAAGLVAQNERAIFEAENNYPAVSTININGGSFIPQNNKIWGGYGDRYYPVLNGNLADNGDGTWIAFPVAGAVKVANGFYFVAESNTYYINSAEGLFYFANQVNAPDKPEYEGNTFAGKTVVLMNDIDLNGAEWAPIGNFGNTSKQFAGIFDGQNHTVSNFKITEKASDRAGKNRSPHGFFGNVNGTVKNLVISNAKLTVDNDGRFAGLVVGRLNGGLIENCHVINSVVKCSSWTIGGIVGQINAGNVSGCSVVDSKIAGAGGVGAIAGLRLNGGESTIENCLVKNCAVDAYKPYGGSYDKMYGAVIGAVYSGTATLNLNGCVVENTTVKGQPSGALYGSYEDGDVIIIDGNKLITSAEDFINAVKNGGTVILGADIAMTTTITPGKSFVIEGNGYTITMADGCVNTYSLFDSIPEGVTAVFNNLTFDGIKGGAILRSIGAEVVMNNVTVQNCDHTQIQGLLRLAGKNTLTNCTFKNNSASMIVTFNYDARYDQPQLVENCVFENNTCKDTAVLYYVKGIGCTLNGNKFINNNVTSTANGATVYMGFTEHNVITNNVFSGNTVVSTGTSKRVSGGIMIGYEAVITGNAFVNNSVSNSAGTALGNDVCASVYYTDIDLSGNYWGGNAPVQNENYFVEYTNHSVIINDYLTSIEE